LVTLILGREHELARRDELIDRAQASGGGVVLVGPAGIGKTALLAEVMRRADRVAFSVLHGAGARLELEYGFGVVRHLFVRALASRSRASDLFEGAAGFAEMPLGLADATDEPTEALGDQSAAIHGLFG
jgi:AAA ATPase domain